MVGAGDDPIPRAGTEVENGRTHCDARNAHDEVLVGAHASLLSPLSTQGDVSCKCKSQLFGSLSAAQVDKKFADLGLGIVDASIVALAERLDVRRILTIDEDFTAVRMGKRWSKGFEFVVPIS